MSRAQAAPLPETPITNARKQPQQQAAARLRELLQTPKRDLKWLFELGNAVKVSVPPREKGVYGKALVKKLAESNAELAAEAAGLLTHEVRSAPTLVKYAEASEYATKTRAELEMAAEEILQGLPVADVPAHLAKRRQIRNLVPFACQPRSIVREP